MKEIYIQPSTKAIKIRTAQMVMTSLPVDTTQGTSTQLSKEFDFFSFEEEEEAPGKSDEDDSWDEFEEEE